MQIVLVLHADETMEWTPERDEALLTQIISKTFSRSSRPWPTSRRAARPPSLANSMFLAEFNVSAANTVMRDDER